MCDSAPHSQIEANVDHRGAASPSPWRDAATSPRRRRRAPLGVALSLAVALLTSAGCTDTCLLNGECPGATFCLDGVCRTACTVDDECPIDEFCLGGGCRGLAPGERAPCRDDAGCLEDDMAPMADMTPDVALDLALDLGPDSALDALADAALDSGPDGGPIADGGLDGLLDGGPDGLLDGGADAVLEPLPDGMPGDMSADSGPLDGGLGVDLTGLYAVTTTVLVATGGALTADEELRHIHRLDWLGGTRYALEVYATDGAFEHRAEIDLASPDGPGRYQYEYPLDVPAPEGCVGSELRFQRGTFEAFEPGYRLLAGEERTVRFAAADQAECAAEGYLVRVDLVWTPLPPP